MAALFAGTLAELGFLVLGNRHADHLRQAYVRVYGRVPSLEQQGAWKRSIPELVRALEPLDPHTGILLEYPLPVANERCDAVVVGRNDRGSPACVVVELKGWRRAHELRDDLVDAGPDGEHVHPCYQAANYAGKLEHFHDVVNAVVFLYNAEQPLLAAKYNVALFHATETQLLQHVIGDKLAGPPRLSNYTALRMLATRSPPNFWRRCGKEPVRSCTGARHSYSPVVGVLRRSRSNSSPRYWTRSQ